ncbi:hypothetical protein SAI_2334, partial [Streptococcus agalactiae H36B]
ALASLVGALVVCLVSSVVSGAFFGAGGVPGAGAAGAVAVVGAAVSVVVPPLFGGVGCVVRGGGGWSW